MCRASLLGLLLVLFGRPPEALKGSGFDGDALEETGVGYVLSGIVLSSSSSYSETEY